MFRFCSDGCYRRANAPCVHVHGGTAILRKVWGSDAPFVHLALKGDPSIPTCHRSERPTRTCICVECRGWCLELKDGGGNVIAIRKCVLSHGAILSPVWFGSAARVDCVRCHVGGSVHCRIARDVGKTDTLDAGGDRNVDGWLSCGSVHSEIGIAESGLMWWGRGDEPP